MNIKLVSFGYHYGVPDDCYVVLDTRHIKNPHRNKQLRYLNGLDKAVQEEVFSSSAAQEIINKVSASIKMAQKEKKEEIIIGIGCSFGRHRSVAIAQRMSELLQCEVEHRDIDKEKKT